MKLEALSIKNFRSIASTTIEALGEFNVVIGKNNAGKSNVLLALNAFFASLRGGVPVCLKPPIGSPHDRHNGSFEAIAITTIFQMNDSERAVLHKEIIAEAPQVRNAVNGILEGDLRLLVTLKIEASEDPFAVVSEIALARPNASTPTFTILSIGTAAAVELADRARRLRKMNEELNFWSTFPNTIDEDDFNRMRASEGRRYAMYRYRGIGESPANFEDVMRSAKDIVAFRESASSFASSLTKIVSDTQNLPLDSRVQSLPGDESSVPAYALQLLMRLAETKILYLTERREPIGPKEAERLLELKVRRGGSISLQKIQETVNALLGVEIDAYRADGANSQSDRKLGAELDVDNALVQLNGAGIREAVRLILDYEFDRPTLLLVEEPEVHLHPALETLMMRYLKSIGRECQVLATTHSTNFLDTGEMNNVYLASRASSTTVERLSLEEAESQIPRELGIRLSSLFMFDRLVFVEGPSDEEVLREFASALGVNWAQQGVGFVHIGGARNFAYFAAEQVMAFLARRRVRIWFVLDHDERSDEEIVRLKAMVGGRASVIVLDRREIENYLLCPNAVLDFVKYKQECAAVARTTNASSAVATDLEECADELKVRTVVRRMVKQLCAPMYPNRGALLDAEEGTVAEKALAEMERCRVELASRAEGVERAFASETEALEASWTARRLELVPGDELIDRVCRRYGVRFHKERDAGKLASFLRADTIATDIAEVVREIGA